MKFIKRCINSLIDFVRWKIWDSPEKVAKIAGYILSGLVGIVLAVSLFLYVDTTPATTNDFKQLENQAKAIVEIVDSLKANSVIKINGDIINITIENDECKIFAEYSQKDNILTVKQDDKSFSVLSTIFFSSIICIGICILIGPFIAYYIFLFFKK